MAPAPSASHAAELADVRGCHVEEWSSVAQKLAVHDNDDCSTSGGSSVVAVVSSSSSEEGHDLERAQGTSSGRDDRSSQSDGKDDSVEAFPYDANPSGGESLAEGSCKQDLMSDGQFIINLLSSMTGSLLELSGLLVGGTGLAMGVTLTFAVSALLAYTFATLGRMSHRTGQRSNLEIGRAVGMPMVGTAMATASLVDCLGGMHMYSLIVSEAGPNIMRYFSLDGWFTDSGWFALAMAAVVYLPLCLQRDLTKLSHASLLGATAFLSILCFMTYRLLDGSYQPGGAFYDAAAEELAEPTLEWQCSLNTISVACILCDCFTQHFNAPRFYHNLKGSSPQRFTRLVCISYGLGATIAAWAVCVGYLTFGESSKGMILGSYHVKDLGAMVSRVMLALSLVCRIPLLMLATVDEILSLAGQPSKKRFSMPTMGAMLVLVTVAAIFIGDIGFVATLYGAVCGNSQAFIVPALFVLGAAWKHSENGGFFRCEVWLQPVIAVVGCIMLVAGLVVDFRSEQHA